MSTIQTTGIVVGRGGMMPDDIERLVEKMLGGPPFHGVYSPQDRRFVHANEDDIDCDYREGLIEAYRILHDMPPRNDAREWLEWDAKRRRFLGEVDGDEPKV